MKNIKKHIAFFIVMLIALFSAYQTGFAASTFSGDRLAEAVRGYITDNVPGDIEAAVSGSVEDQYFEQTGITARCTAKPGTLIGNSYVIVEFLSAEKVIKRLQVPVRVKIYADVPVANKLIHRNSEIHRSDISFERRDITNYVNGQLPSPNSIEGKKVKRNISKGSIITNANIAQENLIQRGDKVEIIVQSGGIRIKAAGTALQDAAPGATIRVRRDGSRSVILSGRVNSDGTVFIAAN